MSETVLCLSLLHDRFSATAVHRGAVAGTWERPEPVADFADFSSVLREAIKQTGFAGTSVTVVLAHQRLAQQLVEAPPVKGRNLKWFLQRRVKQLKPFTSDAAWSYQTTVPTRNAQAVLLHLFPKELLDQLMQGCQEVELQLARVIPSTAILQRQLADLPLEPTEVAVLVAETGGTTTVVIGRKDGQIYLGRTLSSSWNVHPDRVNVDVNRTLLYVKQQFGVSVNTVWLFGDGAESRLAPMQTNLRLPVKLSPVRPGRSYWAEEALKVAVEDTNNLISLEQLEAPRRRLFLRMTALLVGLLALGALATAGGVQLVVLDRTKQFRKLETKEQQLHERRAVLQEREREFLRQKQFVKVVSDDQVQPVPGWFLGYLGNTLPEELFLNHFRLNREGDRWHVELGGLLQPTTNQAPATVLAEAVAALKENLEQGPFHVRVLRESERTNSVAGATPASRPEVSGNGFFVEGVMSAK
jgi:hypothetical protein